jgi:hypothetical protein
MATPDSPSASHAVPEKASTAAPNIVQLPTGKPFTNTSSSEILRANATPVVLLVGSAKCGKTTLLASLHDAFQRGLSFAGFLCAGSRTLMGFEERCFESRFSSGGDKPTTGRTRPADGLMFYHLKLRNQDLRTPVQHLLVADMSGELYDSAMNSATEMQKQTIIRRADYFVHLIDAGRLASDEYRALTRANASLLVRRCLEQNMFQPDARIDVLLTKWDIAIARCGGAQKADEFLKAQRDEISQQWEGKVGRIRIEPIASRPHYKSKLAPAHGLSEFIRSWADEPPRKFDPKNVKFPIVNSDRMFDRFAFREVPGMFKADGDE